MTEKRARRTFSEEQKKQLVEQFCADFELAAGNG